MDELKAPIENAAGATYALVRQFNGTNPAAEIQPGTFVPYRCTTIRATVPGDIRPQAVCPGEWFFLPSDPGGISNFVQSAILASPPSTQASLPGLFCLKPNLLWNEEREKTLWIAMPTLYVYHGLALTSDWLGQIEAYLQNVSAILDQPTFHDYVHANIIAGENPFDELTVAGHFAWQASRFTPRWEIPLVDDLLPVGRTAYEDRNCLLLVDKDFPGIVSGALKIKVRPGWEVVLGLTTGNSGYFTFLQGMAGVQVGTESTNWSFRNSDNRIAFTLRGGDELSISIDPNEHPDLAPFNFRLNLASEGWSQPATSGARYLVSHAALNDQCHVDLLDVRRLDEPQLQESDVDPNAIWIRRFQDNEIRVVRRKSALPPIKRRLIEFARGGIGIPTSVTGLLPVIPADINGNRDLTVFCGIDLASENVQGGIDPLSIEPVPLESLYQRTEERGFSAELEAGGSHPVIVLFLATPRQGVIRCAEVEYLPENTLPAEVGPRFDEIYPIGVISPQWDAVYARWQSQTDGAWRRTPMPRNGRIYVDVTPGHLTPISVYKNDVQCRISIESNAWDNIDLSAMSGWQTNADIILQFPNYLCGIEPQGQKMMQDTQAIGRWIAAHLRYFNDDNLRRTAVLAHYAREHPEIPWAILGHVVSRNQGYRMMDVYGWESAKAAVALLKDFVAFAIELWLVAALPEPFEPVAMLLASFMTLLILQATEYYLDHEAPALNSTNLSSVWAAEELITEGASVKGIVDLAINGIEDFVDYLFVSYQRIVETMNYLSIENGFPQLAAYRWAKSIRIKNGDDVSTTIFEALRPWGFIVSDFAKSSWLTFFQIAQNAQGGDNHGFWKGNAAADAIAADPDVVRHAMRMWIDQEEMLEAGVCGPGQGLYNDYAGYLLRPAYVFTRSISWFGCFSYTIPLDVNGTTRVRTLKPTKQVFGDLMVDYMNWVDGALKAMSPSLSTLLRLILGFGGGNINLWTLMLAVESEDGSSAQGAKARLEKMIQFATQLAPNSALIGPFNLLDEWKEILGAGQGIAQLPPLPEMRDGFGNLDRRVEMMAELYKGLLKTDGEIAPRTRFSAMIEWLDHHETHTGSRSDYGGSDSGGLWSKLAADDTPETFRNLTGVRYRFRINRAGTPDWEAGLAGDPGAQQAFQTLVNKFVRNGNDPLTPFQDGLS